MRKHNDIPRPQSARLARYVANLQRESIAAIPRASGWKDEAKWVCFAPGGIYDRFGPQYVTRYYRVAETLANPDCLAQFIDHHAGNGYFQAIRFATGEQPYCPEHDPALDLPRHVSDLLTTFPDGLRNRLDPVLEALHAEVDQEGFYESRLMEWQRQWSDAMWAAYNMTKGRPQERLRMCREAAEELFPDLLGWFDDLRDNVCGGGHTEAWGWGDERREHM